jgi:tetratricopeptide (TPR) repeat protein
MTGESVDGRSATWRAREIGDQRIAHEARVRPGVPISHALKRAIAKVALSQGFFLSVSREFQAGIAMCDWAIELLEGVGPCVELASAHRTRGKCLRQLNHLDEAQMSYRISGQVAAGIHDRLSEGKALAGLAIAQRSLGNPIAAHKTFLAALELLKWTNHAGYIRDVRHGLGVTFLMRGLLDDAMRTFRELLGEALQLQIGYAVRFNTLDLARCAILRGDASLWTESLRDLNQATGSSYLTQRDVLIITARASVLAAAGMCFDPARVALAGGSSPLAHQQQDAAVAEPRSSNNNNNNNKNNNNNNKPKRRQRRGTDRSVPDGRRGSLARERGLSTSNAAGAARRRTSEAMPSGSPAGSLPGQARRNVSKESTATGVVTFWRRARPARNSHWHKQQALRTRVLPYLRSYMVTASTLHQFPAALGHIRTALWISTQDAERDEDGRVHPEALAHAAREIERDVSASEAVVAALAAASQRRGVGVTLFARFATGGRPDLADVRRYADAQVAVIVAMRLFVAHIATTGTEPPPLGGVPVFYTHLDDDNGGHRDSEFESSSDDEDVEVVVVH